MRLTNLKLCTDAVWNEHLFLWIEAARNRHGASLSPQNWAPLRFVVILIRGDGLGSFRWPERADGLGSSPLTVQAVSRLPGDGEALGRGRDRARGRAPRGGKEGGAAATGCGPRLRSRGGKEGPSHASSGKS